MGNLEEKSYESVVNITRPFVLHRRNKHIFRKRDLVNTFTSAVKCTIMEHQKYLCGF
jgi:hypothetical protein